MFDNANMESPPAPAPSSSRFLRPRVLLVVAFVVSYAWFLRLHTAPFAGGSDSSGYLNAAALLLEGRLSSVKPALPGHAPGDFAVGAHQPLGFLTRAGTDEMAPSYPVGLPLHLAAFSWIAGLDWATIPLNICAVLASAGLFHLLARRLDLSPNLALSGVAALLFCPMFLFAALQPMSDLVALMWSLAALYAALRARENWRWGVACGLAVAWAVLIRPTNLLVVIPVAVALGLDWRAYLWVGLGGLPGAVSLGAYDRMIYGSVFATGYGDVWSAFSREFAAHNIVFFARWIPGLLTPVVLLALLAPFRATLRRREIAVLAAWAVTLIGFYAFYYHSGETWWYLRFILPAFPALILIALAVLQSFPTRPMTRKIGGAILLAGALIWETVLTNRFALMEIKSGEATYYDASIWGRTHLPADAAVICMQVSGALYYYTDFLLLRWDQIDPSKVPPLIATLREGHRPVYAILYDFEEADAKERMGGQWKKITKIRNATIWQVELPAAH
jgi:4-amino-4-deoxy-L-arabinose transferase-like glycosyltransferase